MGIGSTVKTMLRGDSGPSDQEQDASNIRDSNAVSETVGTDDPSRSTNSNRAAHLPSGTGPGTSGKGSGSKGSAFAHTSDARPVDPESAVQQDIERSRGGDIFGFGTDAAAAAGGSLSSSHQANNRRGSNARPAGSSTIDPNTRKVFTTATATGPTPAESSKRASQAAKENISKLKGQTLTSNLQPTKVLTNVSESSEIDKYGDQKVRLVHEKEVTEREYEIPTQGSGEHMRVVENMLGSHQVGHSKPTLKDAMPPNGDQDISLLQPVTHERVRHFETEEVSRIKELDQHNHYLLYQTQPVIASEELAEQIRENTIPVTTINSIHTNKAEDHTLFEGHVHQCHDTVTHGAKERTVIDKGTTIKAERVHHHCHHIIQPVIEKETIDKQVIRTTIPIHEIVHEAPVVYQPRTRTPVSLEHFLSHGGTINGGISQDAISKKVLRMGQCSREVDGMAETLESDLHLKDIGSQGKKKVIETDEQIRTTVVPLGKN